jgi:hypothetical protein
VANPRATFTATGKNASRKAVITAGTVPTPNHSTRSGTTAALGMLLKPTSSGYRASCTVIEEPMTKPRKSPRTTATTNPTRVVSRV